MVEIRRCRSDEIDLVMRFIDQHWQKGHALAVSRALMDWQHGAIDGAYDYLIAIRDGQLLGILGYIATRRFDPQLAKRNVIWLALWKVLDDCGVAGLGLRMLNALNQVEAHIAIAVNGINIAHPPMYRALRYRVAELQRFFVVNPDMHRRLIQMTNDCELPTLRGKGSEFVEMTELALSVLPPELMKSGAVPDKSPVYFLNRFLRHPFYRYRVFLASGKDHKPALYATRTAQHDGACALRIVDFVGDPTAISHCGEALAKLMNEERAEYADFWQMGLPEQYFADAGFAKLDPDGSIIVPNYFEPYLARNGRLFCAIRSSDQATAVFCRADGDQDRPSRLGGGVD
jgi:hypothetical protein